MSDSQGSSPDRPALFVPGVRGLYDAGEKFAWPLIRVTAGLFLMPHGAQKLFGMFGGGGLEATNNAFEQYLGLSPGWFWGTSAGSIEFFGGLLLVLGLFTRPAAIAAGILLCVAVFQVHLGNGYFWNGRDAEGVIQSGYEFPMMWMLLMVAIFFRGGGAMSLDRKIGREF